MKKIIEKFIAFDLDDTLYKEIDFVKSAYMHIAKHFTGLAYPYDCYRTLLDAYLNKEDAFAKLNDFLQINYPVKRYLELYRFHYPDISLLPGTAETLDFLRQKGWQLGLITDGRSITQRNKILALDIEKYFDSDNTRISDETGYIKLSSHNFRYFMNRYPDCKEFVYVGDNTEKDFIWPKQLGWTTIGIRDNGQNIHPQTKRSSLYEPEIWIDDITSLKTLL